jgi:hypothetical protein
MCRPCTAVEEGNVVPSEIAGFSDPKSMLSHFSVMKYQK